MISHFILFVSDQDASTAFYSAVLEQKPILHVPGMTEFQLGASAVLGLMPNTGIKRLLGDTIQNPGDFPKVSRSEIYLRVKDVHHSFQLALDHGAELLSPVSTRNWGSLAGYVKDPDGHIVAFSD